MNRGVRGGNSPSSGQGTAAFVVGCVMTVGLFAAAVLGYLPPSLMSPVVRLCIAVAGGGFTMFLLGYMSATLPNGLKVGGPLGVFVLLFLLTPAEQIKAYFNPNLTSCESNVDDKPSVAESYCAKAAEELPSEPRPVYLLGVAQSNSENYRAAIDSWRRALALGYDKALTHSNIAFGQYQLGEYEDAIKTASLAANESGSNKGIQADSWYLIAEAERRLWYDGQGDSVHFTNAKDKYLAFIEAGSPHYRAQGNLACMFATKAALTADHAQKTRLEDDALSHFDKAIAAIRAYSGREGSSEKLAFVAEFRPNGNACSKVLAELWARKRPDQNYESLVASVPG
jgi:tetratricopeptide (TPR) repeat protein